MSRAARFAAAIAAVTLGLACAPGARVDFDASHDFRRARSWDWLPQGDDTPPPARDPELHDRLGDAIERELAQRGLVRSPAPDLYVACQVALAREQVLRTETPADKHLPSLHQGSPSYDVGTSEQRLVEYENALVRIEVRDAASRRVVWSAVIERRVRGRFLAHAERAVAELLAGFPPPPPPAREARAPRAPRGA